MWTDLGFRLPGDFWDVARSVDYLVIDLRGGDAFVCTAVNPPADMLTPSALEVTEFRLWFVHPGKDNHDSRPARLKMLLW